MTTATDIQQLYVAFFNRPADSAGLSYWVDQAAKNGGVDFVANAFSASPEYQATFNGMTSAEAVNAIYMNLFGRPAEPDGITYWTSALDNGLPMSKLALTISQGAQSADAIAVADKVAAASTFTTATAASPDKLYGYSGDAAVAVAKSWLAGVTDDASLAAKVAVVDTTVAATAAAHLHVDQASLAQLYVGLFDRAPDHDGLAYWTGQLASGATIKDVANAMAASNEAAISNVSANDLIAKFYLNVLGRPVDPEGLAYWSAELATKQPGEVLTDILAGLKNSPLTDASTHDSQVLLANKVGTGLYYAVDLGGNDAAVAHTVNDLVTVSTGADANGSGNAAADAAALAATHPTPPVVVPPGPPVIVVPPIPVDPLALTAGTDALVGTAGNDQVTATSTTLTAGDSINGLAGSNSLTVIGDLGGTLPANVTLTNIQTVNLAALGTLGAAAVNGGASAVAYDLSGQTGVQTINTNSTGGAYLKASATADVNAQVSGSLGGPGPGGIGIGGIGGLMANNTGIDIAGGKNITLTVGPLAAGNIAIEHAAGTVNISDSVSGAAVSGPISVTAEGNVTVSQHYDAEILNSQQYANVFVNGGANTHTVNVSDGVNGTTGTILITDGHSGSTPGITNVTAAGFQSMEIDGDSVTNLSLAFGHGSVAVRDVALNAGTANTLNISMLAQQGGELRADNYVNEAITLVSGTDHVAFAGNALSTLSVGATGLGTRVLTIDSLANATSLSHISVTGVAGIAGDLSSSNVTVIDASLASGNNSVTIAGTTAYTGSFGVDNVHLTSVNASTSVNLGSGNDTLTFNGTLTPTAGLQLDGGAGINTLAVSMADADLLTHPALLGDYSGVTNFQNLNVLSDNDGAVDAGAIAGLQNISFIGATDNAFTVDNVSSSQSVTLSASSAIQQGAYTVNNAASETDLHLNLVSSAGTDTAFASGHAVTSNGFGYLDINTVDTTNSPVATIQSVDVEGNFSIVNVSGNASLNLTSADAFLSSIDASAMTHGGVIFNAGSIMNGILTVTGSNAGGNVIDASGAASSVLHYTDAAGAGSIGDIVTDTNTLDNTVTLGNGDNHFTGGTGNNTLTVGNGSNTITVGTGNNTVTTGNGISSLTAGDGNNTITVGDGGNHVTAGLGDNTITAGAGNDTITATDGNNTIQAGTGTNTVTVGNGNNTIDSSGLNSVVQVGGGVNVVHLGVVGGTLNVASADSNVAIDGTLHFTTLADATNGDILGFASNGASSFNTTAVDVTAAAGDLRAALDIATGGDGSGASAATWFQLGGDTYVVEDNSSDATFVDGQDIVVKLTGTHDLGGSFNIAGTPGHLSLLLLSA